MAKSIIWSVCIYILFTELCERLAFYTFSGSLVEFMTSNLGTDGVFAIQMSSLFSALVYLTPILGGWIADEYLGRYATIVVFVCIYMVGLLFGCIAAYPSILSQPLFLTGLLLFVAFGAGGIKANVVTLGGDQFDDHNSEHTKQRQSYFNYFYWAINIGALIALGYFSNLAFNPVVFSGGVIASDMGFFTTFLITLAALMCAFIVFLAGTPKYVKKPPNGHVFSSFIKEAPRTLRSSGKGSAVFYATIVLLLSALLIIISFFTTSKTGSFVLAIVAMCLIIISCSTYGLLCNNLDWLEIGYDYATAQVQNEDQRKAKTARNIKDILHILPFWGMLVVFWMCYNQQSTNFQLQGCQMNYLTGNVIMSPAFFQTFDALIIIVLLPLVDKFLYPFVERKLGRPIKTLEKMNVGFIMVTLGMLSAGIIETARQKSPDAALHAGFPPGALNDTGVQSCCVSQGQNCYWAASGGSCADSSFCGNTTVISTITGEPLLAWQSCKYNSECSSNGSIQPIKELGIWVQITAYVFIGLGEIFTSATSYEFFYKEVDSEFRSVSQGFNLWTTAFGSFAIGGFSSIFQAWLPNNLNEPDAHLDLVFYIISILTFIVAAIWWRLQGHHVYRDERIEEESKSRSSSSTGSKSSLSDLPHLSSAQVLAVEKV